MAGTRLNWTALAASLGYPDSRAMWTDLYVRRKLSIAQIAEKLDIGRNTVRDELTLNCVEKRSRGGRNNVKFELTDEVLQEVQERGIAVVAKRLGVTHDAVYKRVRHLTHGG